MKHLPIGGSTIARTINCPAWISRNKKAAIPPRKAGSAANLGNLLHDAMENYYKDYAEFENQIGKTSFADLVLSEEHLPLLRLMREHTETVLDEYGITQILCEPFVQIIPDLAGGSIDMLGISEDGKTIIILDYKTGVGVVRAKENKQILFYALCASVDIKTKALFKNVENFVGVIIQPRVFKAADIWEFYPAELTRFNTEVGKTIEATQDKNPKAKAGAHCKFCPMESFCDDKRARVEAALILDTKQQKQLNRALPLALELKTWCEQVINDATSYAEKGVDITGHKLVHGRSLRRWKDESAAEGILFDQLGKLAFNKTLISPAQAAKIIKKEKIDFDIDHIITKPLGKLALAPLDDPREKVIPDNGTEKLKKALDKKPTKN